MRQPFIILFVIIFYSCKQKSEPAATIQDSASTSIVTKPDTQKIENKTAESTDLEWEKQEDSLRTAILDRKENKILKMSFLQEMYIRNVVKVLKDSLLVNIPFDLHGPDCGAPDCYSTDISFRLKLGSALVFPENMQFHEYEHGCVDKEKQLTGNFRLVEQTDKHVIYHSAKYKRTLVLFKSNKENGTTAYYFTGVGQNKINGKNVYRIVEEYDEENRNSIYPFTSWVLTTNAYENFLHK